MLRQEAESFPDEIERLCCPWKGVQHGSVWLRKITGEVVYSVDEYFRSGGWWAGYARESNGDMYFWPTFGAKDVLDRLDDDYYVDGRE